MKMTLEEFLYEWRNDSPTLLVHTSGSTGKPKPMWVEKQRMEASARITCRFLGLKEGDTALLCLPLDYIAGKMMVVRAETCGLQLLSVPPTAKTLASHIASFATHIDFAAMVPLQVWTLMQTEEGRRCLRGIRHLIIGGGAVDQALADALAEMAGAVWSTYGMTETLSHIALRRLNGPERSAWYTPFDGVRVGLADDGCLMIDAPAVHDGILKTNDIAELRSPLPLERPECVAFRILGRKDNVICSGGIKIQAEEVERLLALHISTPFIITKAPEKKLGEQVVLLTESVDITPLITLCRQVLPRYWQPRRVFSVDSIPMTETGKPARKEAERLAYQLTTRME